jgi:hypothetical protein
MGYDFLGFFFGKGAERHKNLSIYPMVVENMHFATRTK